MIERRFVAEKIKEFQIQEYITKNLSRVGHSHTKLQRTPLGEKIVIHASRPGLIVGRKGQNIKKLTSSLKNKFKLENPQIEISEVENINLDARIVAERIADSLERFGSSRFKSIGHRTMEDVMNSEAMGIEILISGKIPGSRAKRWRFYQGYLKKCGDISKVGVRKAYTHAQLKTGVIGIQVRIMPSDIRLPDDIRLTEEIEEVIEEVSEENPSDDAQEQEDSNKPDIKEESKSKKTKKTSKKEKDSELSDEESKPE